MNTSSFAISALLVLGETAPDLDTSPFARYGIAGLVIAWFIYRDFRQSGIEVKRQETQDGEIAKLVASVNSLVRITAMEVMSRPNVIARAKAEAAEITNNLPDPKG